MKVAKVEKIGNADVFNMEVEDTHDFVIQGGVVAHNCADEARYFCMMRPIAPRKAKIDKPLRDDPLNMDSDYAFKHKNRVKYY